MDTIFCKLEKWKIKKTSQNSMCKVMIGPCVISCSNRGVQVRVRTKYRNSYFVHCYACRLIADNV